MMYYVIIVSVVRKIGKKVSSGDLKGASLTVAVVVVVDTSNKSV